LYLAMRILNPLLWGCETILHGRALAALAIAWVTTAGHTMNFKEMDGAMGWISAQGYSLHSALLLSIAFGFILAKKVGPLFSPLFLTRLGLIGLAVGSFINGGLIHAPYSICIAGRIIAGLGTGLVLFSSPSMIPPYLKNQGAWAGIVIPAFAPGIVGTATFMYGWSNWEGGFLFEGALAVLALLLFIPDLEHAQSTNPSDFSWYSLIDLPFFASFLCGIWYLMHWGQLNGWWESNRVFLAAVCATFSLGLFLFFASTGQVVLAFKNLWPRLTLVFYAGLVQYFNVSDMGVYGGIIVNFNVLQRPWLVWSISFGGAAALATGQFLHSFRSLPIFGLLILSLGMHLAHERTMGWNYWDPLNQVEFNWFAAPQHWQLAIPRFLMGFGVGWILLGMQNATSGSDELEKQSKQQLVLFQFLGGAISIGILVNYLLIGHQYQYSFTADRGFIQQSIVEEYRGILESELKTQGFIDPSRGSHSMMYKSVNYEADNLIFAHIYKMFSLTSLALALLFIFINMVKKMVAMPYPTSLDGKKNLP